MHPSACPWDFLIVTAPNAAQAAAYESQLKLRRELGLLAGVNEVLVVADPPQQRIGSGGSTVLCLCEVLRRTCASGAGPSDWLVALRRLRILVVHAGGDSRRLPAYGPCGKIFIPVPGESDSAIAARAFRYKTVMCNSANPKAKCRYQGKYAPIPARFQPGGFHPIVSKPAYLIFFPAAAVPY